MAFFLDVAKNAVLMEESLSYEIRELHLSEFSIFGKFLIL